MKIIGHRGARGLVDENTLESFKKALETGVDAVEFDVWTTKDGVVVVHHDSDLIRMTGHDEQIFDVDYAEIKKLKTPSGYRIPSAEQVIEALDGKPFFLEIKDFYLSQPVLDLLDKYKSRTFCVTSFQHQVLIELKKLRPDLKIYPATNWHPLETLDLIRTHDFYGMNLNYRMLNSIVYWLCRHYRVHLMVFPVNSRLFVRYLKLLWPKTDICTDYPDRMVKPSR